MQDKKEHFTGLVRIIKNRLRDWWVSYDRKLWTARIFVYSVLLLLVVSVGAILFTHFNLFHTEANSARYMLSALVQSQAAIVAIVITLTLIAVQLTASAYSPRVIDIFKNNPDMWLLLGFYGFSIFFGFIVLKLVVGAEGEAVSQSAILSLGFVSVSFEFCVSLAHWLGAFTFVALFPYMLNIIGLLKPENIIKRLAIDITKDKILNTKEDPIQPIMDIIHVSIRKYDIETTRVGLRVVTERVTEIIDSNSEKGISERFCRHLGRVGGLAASKMDEESTTEVIENLELFGKSTAIKGLEYATWQAAWSLGDVGRTAAEKGFEYATKQAAWSLGDVGRTAVEKGFENATQQVAESLGDVGKIAAEKELEDVTWEAARSLWIVGEGTAEKGFEYATSKAENSLEGIGKATAEKGFEDVTSEAVEFIGDVGRIAAEKGLKRATSIAIMSMEAIGEDTAVKRLEDATVQAAWSLGYVGRAVANKGVAKSLRSIGITAAENGLEDAIGEAVRSLASVGIAATEKGFEKVALQVAESIIAVGRTAEENELEDATRWAAKSLAELTNSSEEIVKTAIQDYKSKLKEEDGDSFKKFMKIYEQKREELRA